MQETPGAPAGGDARERKERTGRLGESSTGLSIEELAEAADLPVRTIRYYISQGLLPGPGGRGKHATYGEEQLARLHLIRRLAARRVPLAQMRKLLAPLRLEDVRALLAHEEGHAAALERAQRSASPREYVAGLLQRARAMRDGPIVSGEAGPSGQAHYAMPYPPRSAMRPQPPATPLREGPLSYSSGAERRASPPGSPSAVGPRPAEAWQRWELAPGVELQVRADAERTFRALIRRVLAAAQEGGEEAIRDVDRDVDLDES